MRGPLATLMFGLLWASGAAFGAEVLFTVSARETYVGAPVQIQVVVKRAQEHEPPVFPEVEGADVRQLRSDDRGYARITRPGREARLTTTYTYIVIPRRAGTLTIPPIRVVADGEPFSTAPMQIVAKQSEAGDLLFLRLMGESDSVYVGEPIEVTLEIWLKPFRTKTVRMDAVDMWLHTVDERASTWGPFIENLQGPVRDITYPVNTTPDESGTGQRYFVYRLNRKVWPERGGVFDADGVSVLVNYPLRVRRNPLAHVGDPYEVAESRPISAAVAESTILVRTPPEEDRPDGFRGAVGKYTMSATATPTHVSVGDPITLTVAIRGTGRMDWLQAPALARQESLTADFHVPDEELAGTVNGMGKQFSQTIRAKHDGVTEIPPIEFSYFDPQDGRYVTLKSAPIPLEVEPSPRVATDNDRGAPRTDLTPVESGLLANYGDIQALTRQQSLSLGAGTWAFAASGPLLYLVSSVIRRQRDRAARDAGLKRRRSARKRALTLIRTALADVNSAATASHIAAAVTGYIADRCNLPAGIGTRSDAVSALRTCNVPEPLIDRLDSLLAECEEAQYAAAQSESVSTRVLADRARSCLNELERLRL
jgi:hypothetical protein